MDLLVELGRLNALNRTSQGSPAASARKPATGFQDVLQSTLIRGSNQPFQISGHAEKRISERNISMDGSTRSVLNASLDELMAKGARDSLIVTRDAAFVFNVPNRMMVTAMDLHEVQNRLITQIDSVMIRNT